MWPWKRENDASDGAQQEAGSGEIVESPELSTELSERNFEVGPDLQSPLNKTPDEKKLRRRWHVPIEDKVDAAMLKQKTRTPEGSMRGTDEKHITFAPATVGEGDDHLSNSSKMHWSIASGVESNYGNDTPEAVRFAGEVKRYSKETFAKGAKTLKKKLKSLKYDFGNDASQPSKRGGDDIFGDDDNDKNHHKEGLLLYIISWLEVFLPCISWLRTYKVKEYFLHDAIAGISVALMVVPQSISYAALAGLPSQFGLYTALLPVMMYVLFGSSRQLAVGPVAIVSLLLKEGLHSAIPESLAIQDPNNPIGDDQIAAQSRYNIMALQATFFVGIIELAMGLVRMGFLTNFLSHSVILGFTHGGAILIGLSQVKHVIGIKAPNAKATLQDMIKAYVKAGDTFDWRVLIMGLGFLALLILMKEVGKRAGPRFKFMRTLGPLTASVLGIGISYGIRLDKYGIPLVGKFPGGFPPITFGELVPMDMSTEFVTLSVTCAVVGLLESVSIAKRLAVKNKYQLHANQELRALGIANIVGAGFSAYPGTGSFSRSAVSNDTGCKTTLGGAFTAVIVLLVVLFMTKPFYYMPMSALGAIVISGVIGLLDFNEALFLFRISKVDFLVWAASFFGTLLLGAELGLAIAIGLALICVIYESAFPQVAELGRLQSTTVYRNIKQYPAARRMKGILVLRIGAPIYFANCSYVRDMFEYYLKKCEKEDRMPAIVVFEMSPVSHVDATGLHMMKDMIKDYKEQGGRFMLTNPNQSVMRALQHARILTVLGTHNVFVRVHDAVKEAAHALKERDLEDAIDVFFDDLCCVDDKVDDMSAYESPKL